MRTIFDITDFEPEIVGKWFKSRLDWDNPETPQYSGTGKSKSVNWAGGKDYDFCKYRTWLHNDSFMFYGDHMELWSTPTPDGVFSTMLVGNFLINTGRLTIDIEFSCDPNVCEAVWFLSQARYERGAETILPEYDILETNTPGHVGMMSESKITSYDPFKATCVHKMDSNYFKQILCLTIDIKRTYIRGLIDGIFFGSYMPRPLGVPVYPIIWNIVPNHLEPPKKTVVTKIYRIKFEC